MKFKTMSTLRENQQISLFDVFGDQTVGGKTYTPDGEQVSIFDWLEEQHGTDEVQHGDRKPHFEGQGDEPVHAVSVSGHVAAGQS